jgi:hypothetical protein
LVATAEVQVPADQTLDTMYPPRSTRCGRRSVRRSARDAKEIDEAIGKLRPTKK